MIYLYQTPRFLHKINSFDTKIKNVDQMGHMVQKFKNLDQMGHMA